MSFTEHADHTPYEKMVIEAFQHDVSELSVYSVEHFPADLREVFVSLVEEGRPIGELESQCFGGLVDDSELIRFLGQGKGRPHFRAFVVGMTALLGHKDYHHKATAYILANLDRYLEMSKGVFDELYKPIDKQPKVSSLGQLPNYCRNEDDSLRSKKTIARLAQSNSDYDVLLLSAIANLDSDAVRLLSGLMAPEKVFGALRHQMAECPALGVAFGHFFEQRTHVVFLAEMKQLMESSKSTREDFERAFWPGASSAVIDDLVSKAVKFHVSKKPQLELMLQVFRANKVDFYPGLLLSEKGQGHYFDALGDMPDLAARQEFIMDVMVKRVKLKKLPSDQDLSVLLLDIPLETIQSHKNSDALLKYLYMGTNDKAVLRAIEDKKFRGDMLENELGM